MRHFYSFLKTYIKLQFTQIVLIFIAIIMLFSATVAVYASHFPNKMQVFKQYIQAKYKITDVQFERCVQADECYEFATTNLTKEQLKIAPAYTSFETGIPELRWLRTEVVGKLNAQQLYDELKEKGYEINTETDVSTIIADKRFINNFGVTKNGKTGVISFIYYDDKVQYIAFNQRYPLVGLTSQQSKFDEFMHNPELKFGTPDVYLDRATNPNSTKIYLRHGLAFVGQKELFIFTPTTEYNPEVMDIWLQYGK